jgi:hypothetical protein
MVKLALEYELETGRPGFDLSPIELMWRMRILGDREKVHRVQMANAVAVGMSGDPKAWDLLK